MDAFDAGWNEGEDDDDCSLALNSAESKLLQQEKGRDFQTQQITAETIKAQQTTNNKTNNNKQQQTTTNSNYETFIMPRATSG